MVGGMGKRIYPTTTAGTNGTTIPTRLAVVGTNLGMCALEGGPWRRNDCETKTKTLSWEKKEITLRDAVST